MADRKYPRHVFWGAGEPDCPEDLKAPNGELIDMRCKVCGDGWLQSHEVCMAALKTVPDAERLCRALRQFVKLVPAGDECRLQLTVGAQSFFIGIEPMPEGEAAHFAGLFVLALAGIVQQVTHGVKVGTIGHVAPPGFGPMTDAAGVMASDAREPEPQLVGYDDCRCVLTQYCDGTCRPVFALPAVLECAKTLYANSPGAYRGTRPLPWDQAPMPTRLEFIGRAKVEEGRRALGVTACRWPECNCHSPQGPGECSRRAAGVGKPLKEKNNV